MILLELVLENFKGIKRFELFTDGKNIDIYGDNASGKTTLSDGYFWLLFGKDSSGSATFDVLPEDEDGNIIQGLNASVRGVFRRESGEEFSLRRVYKQVFTRKNGEAEHELKGNTTDFYIDDVPKPNKDYSTYVSEICEETTLALLSDPDRFPGKMHWDKRRDLLIRQFANETCDRKIIQAHEELMPLITMIGMKSVDDYAAIARERRKAINRELGDIPGRIDEAEKAKPADAIPLPTDGPRLGQLTVEKSNVEDEINRLRSGESASTMRKEIAEMDTDMARAGMDYMRRVAVVSNADDLSRARSERTRWTLSIGDRKARLQNTASQMAGIDRELSTLRQSCIDNFGATFDPGEGICPTCGQTYPDEQTDKLRAAWNEQKANRQEGMESHGRQMKASRDELTGKVDSEQLALAEDERHLNEVETRMRILENQAEQIEPWETTPEFESMNLRLSAKCRQLDELQKTIDFHVGRAREKLASIVTEIAEIDTRMKNKETIERQNTRIKQLKADEKRLALELAGIDNGLRLADEFIQAKASDVEESVNSAFRIVRWKLFDRQINGGIKACCEATVNGIEYGTNLNSAARLNAGLDIISALSKKMGVSFPIWIDNAEGVQKLIPVHSQLIQAIVPLAYDKLGEVVQDSLINQYGSEKAARAAYEAPNKQLHTVVR